MFCQSCGAEISEKANFCSVCGQEVAVEFEPAPARRSWEPAPGQEFAPQNLPHQAQPPVSPADQKSYVVPAIVTIVLGFLCFPACLIYGVIKLVDAHSHKKLYGVRPPGYTALIIGLIIPFVLFFLGFVGGFLVAFYKGAL